jgi:alpha-soluble NSF attachment protein
VESAQELFQQAAVYYKANNRWESAGNAYLRAQECAAKLKCPIDCATYFQDAALMFKKVNIWKAAECTQKALEIRDQSGQIGRSAKLANELAEMFDTAGDMDNAVTWYNKAADYYRVENSISTGNQCRLKVAQFKAIQGYYGEAIETYENVAEQYLDDPLLKSSSTRFFFVALLCRLARHDPASQIQDAFSRYQNMDLQFSADMREHKFCVKIIAALEEVDVDAWQEAVNEFTSISPFDELKTSLMEAAVKALENPSLV